MHDARSMTATTVSAVQLITWPTPDEHARAQTGWVSRGESAENRDYLAAIMARLGIKGLRFFWTRYVPLDVW